MSGEIKKIALCFLVYDRIECEALWERWLKSHPDGNKFTLYVHSKFDFQMESEFLRARMNVLADPVPTEWAGFSLVEATQLLFVAAMADSNNYKCVLLSNTCIPVKPVNYIWKFLTCNNLSYIFESKKTERWPRYKELLRVVPHAKISKHHQWIILGRQHIELMHANFHVIKELYTGIRISDESWALTFLQICGLDNEINTHYQSTYTNWHAADIGGHPKLYKEIDTKELKKIVFGEYLFARKFENFAGLTDSMFQLFDEQRAMSES
uniref:Core-2/I-Branching enzyme n=1 Tax=viral metagenome TaxID=1070528 RepID=A0A6C0IEV6_9ZZZZ